MASAIEAALVCSHMLLHSWTPATLYVANLLDRPSNFVKDRLVTGLLFVPKCRTLLQSGMNNLLITSSVAVRFGRHGM